MYGIYAYIEPRKHPNRSAYLPVSNPSRLGMVSSLVGRTDSMSHLDNATKRMSVAIVDEGHRMALLPRTALADQGE